MITRAKNYTKKKNRKNPQTNKQNKWTDRTLGQMEKAKLYRKKLHTEAYTYTITKREKGKKYIYIVAPKVHLLNFGMIRCLSRYSTHAGNIKLIVEI